MTTDREEGFYIKVFFLTTAACFIYMVGAGIRNNFGIMLNAITEHASLSFASVSFVLAVGQFSYGMTQPLSGVLAERKGQLFSILSGIVCTLMGVILLPLCKSQWSLMLVLGVLLPGGIGILSYGLLIDILNGRLPQVNKPLISGIVNASSGFGNTLLAPVISGAIVAGGIVLEAWTLAIISVVMLPAAIVLCGKGGVIEEKSGGDPGRQTIGFRQLVQMGLTKRDYVFIVIGFFTCGFHMAIITNHLATEIMSYGFSIEMTSYMFSVYGVATVIGAFLSGVACTKLRMKNVLGTLYGSRMIWIIFFFFLPKTVPIILIYIMLLGFTGASTVTPVAGICHSLFGKRGLTIFFGVAFVAHQIGGFFSSWLGGVFFQSLDSYSMIWIIDAILCTLASFVSYKIQINEH